MAKKLDDVIAALPKERQQRVQARAMELATLKDLRLAAEQTQQQLAATLGVGQDTISRLEKRSDMLLSTLAWMNSRQGSRREAAAGAGSAAGAGGRGGAVWVATSGALWVAAGAWLLICQDEAQHFVPPVASCAATPGCAGLRLDPLQRKPPNTRCKIWLPVPTGSWRILRSSSPIVR